MEILAHVPNAEMDQLGKLIRDLWPKLNEHDKVRLIEGVQRSLSEVLSENPELKNKCDALRVLYTAKAA